MSIVEHIFQSLQVQNIEFDVDFPQVVIDFSIQHAPHQAGDFQIGISASEHTYYFDADALDFIEVLTEHPTLGMLDAQQAAELAKLIDDRLVEVYLEAGLVLERSLRDAQANLLAFANDGPKPTGESAPRPRTWVAQYDGNDGTGDTVDLQTVPVLSLQDGLDFLVARINEQEWSDFVTSLAGASLSPTKSENDAQTVLSTYYGPIEDFRDGVTFANNDFAVYSVPLWVNGDPAI